MADKQNNKGLKAEKLGITIPLSKVKGQLDSNINKVTKEAIKPLKDQLEEMQYLPKEKPVKVEGQPAEKPKKTERPEWAVHKKAVDERDALRKKLNASKKELPDEERANIKAQLDALGKADKAVELHNKISEARKDQVRFCATAFSALACGLQFMLDSVCSQAKAVAGANKVAPSHLLASKVRDSPMYTYFGTLAAYNELIDFKAKHDESKRLEREFGARWVGFENTADAALIAKRDAERAAIDRNQAPSEFTFDSKSAHASKYTKYVSESCKKLGFDADKLFCDFVATLLAQFVDRMCPYLRRLIKTANSKTVDLDMVTGSLELMAEDGHTSADALTGYISDCIKKSTEAAPAPVADASTSEAAPADAAATTPTDSVPRKKGGRRAKVAA